MTISASTKVHDLLKTHPFLEDFLASYDGAFEMLRNRMARATMRRTREAAEKEEAQALAAESAALARDVVEMVCKEEKTLVPLAMQRLSEEEWAEIRRGEDMLGYAIARPAADWFGGASESARAGAGGQGGAHEASRAAAGAGQDGAARAETDAALAPTRGEARVPHARVQEASAPGMLSLLTGALPLEQVRLIFTHLPLDLSFVDEHDEVRFYSEGPARIFPRSPAVIGRKVQLCHPPKSVHVVQEILDLFRAGTKDEAEFWIQLHGRFLHIRYFAVRDSERAYRGCLEVTQDVTRIREPTGERRLLAWRDA